MGFALKFVFWATLWSSLLVVGYFSPEFIEIPLLHTVFVIFGIFFTFYGLLLNAIGGRTLKKYGHFEIRQGIQKPERLVTAGIYSCMRHPAQFGSIFFGLGIAFLTAKLLVILYGGWVSFLALYFILYIEERETIKNFGEAYCIYAQKVPPFTFSISCMGKGIKALRKK